MRNSSRYPINSRIGLPGIARFFIRMIVAAWALSATLAVAGGSSKAYQGLTLYVTDRGINQMPAQRDAGEASLTWTMSELQSKARIAVLMPDDSDMARKSIETIRAEILAQIEAQVDAGRRAGLRTFEIQLVQNINSFGYFDPDRQKSVDRFGAAAYGAIADLNSSLKKMNVPVVNRAILGSNGTKVFAANVDIWSSAKGKSLWDRVDMFDGRAFETAIVKAIERISVDRVRLFNTDWDLPGPNTPVGWRSISNQLTTQDIKDRFFPSIKVYVLTRQDQHFNLGDLTHTAGMLDAKEFKIKEYAGRDLGWQFIAGTVRGRDLRPDRSLPASVKRAIPKEQREEIEIWRQTAEDAVGAFKTFADNYGEAFGKGRRDSKAFKLAGAAMELSKAITDDIVDSRDKPVVPLRSHTVEALGNFGLEWLANLPITKNPLVQPFALNVEAFKNIKAGLTDMSRKGTIDSDIIKSFTKAGVESTKAAAMLFLHDDYEAEFRIASRERAVESLRHQIDVSKARSGGNVFRAAARGEQRELVKLEARLASHEAQLVAAKETVAMAEQKLGAWLLYLDVLPELMGAVIEHAEKGSMTIGVADRYSDAFLMAAATLAVAPVASIPGLGLFAPAIRDAIFAGERFTREQTREPIEQAYKALVGNKFEILDQYQTYQARAVHDKQAVKSIGEIYGDDELRKIGFNKKELTQLNENTASLNWHRQHPEPAPTKTARDIAGNKPDLPGEDKDRTPKKPGNSTNFAGNSGQQPPPPPPPHQSPPPSPHPGIGGIKPHDSQAVHYADMPIVDAVVVEPGTGNVVLLAQGQDQKLLPIDPTTLAFALWAVYTDKHLAFSLDPADGNPNGEWLKAVYLPPETEGLGLPAQRWMFDADVMLKMLGFGVKEDEQHHIIERPRGLLPGLPQMIEEEHGKASGQWTRYWITPKLIELAATGGVVQVKTVRMQVLAKRQALDPKSPTGLRDAQTDPDSMESRWARKATDLYDRLATSDEAPQFARVAELTKALAIAHWLHESGARVDVNSLVPILNGARGESVAKMRPLKVTFQKDEVVPIQDQGRRGVRRIHHELHLVGGIDPDCKLESARRNRVEALLRPDDCLSRVDSGRNPRLESLGSATLQAKLAAKDQQVFVVEFMAKRYLASTLPIKIEMASQQARR